MTRPGQEYSPENHRGQRANAERAEQQSSTSSAPPPGVGAPPGRYPPGAVPPDDERADDVDGPWDGPWGLPDGLGDLAGAGVNDPNSAWYTEDADFSGGVAGAAGPVDLGGVASEGGYERPPWETTPQGGETVLAGAGGDSGGLGPQGWDSAPGNAYGPPVAPPDAAPAGQYGGGPTYPTAPADPAGPPPPAAYPAPAPAAPPQATPPPPPPPPAPPAPSDPAPTQPSTPSPVQPAGPPPTSQVPGQPTAPPVPPQTDEPAVRVSVDGRTVASGQDGVTVGLDRSGGVDVTPVPGPEDGVRYLAPEGGDDATGDIHVHGEGENGASVDISLSDELAGLDVRTSRNADGSVDVTVPPTPVTGGHEMAVRGPAGQDVDLRLGRGEDGLVDLKVTPDPGGDRHGPSPLDRPAPPAGDAAGPDTPEQPDTSSAPPPAGGGGGPPPGGGGGGGGPSPGSNSGDNGGSRGRGSGEVKADPERIRELGRDLVSKVAPAMDEAARRAAAIEVPYPAFGVLGFPLNMAHGEVRDYANNYITAGSTQLHDWQGALRGMADNWEQAEQSSTIEQGP